MSETRKEGSTLEPIRLLVDVPTLTPFTEESIGRVRLLGAKRVNRVLLPATVDVDIPSDPPIEAGFSGWSFDVELQRLTVTWYPGVDELPKSYYFWEVWIYDEDDSLLLKTPCARGVIQEVRESIQPVEL